MYISYVRLAAQQWRYYIPGTLVWHSRPRVKHPLNNESIQLSYVCVDRDEWRNRHVEYVVTCEVTLHDLSVPMRMLISMPFEPWHIFYFHASFKMWLIVGWCLTHAINKALYSGILYRGRLFFFFLHNYLNWDMMGFFAIHLILYNKISRWIDGLNGYFNSNHNRRLDSNKTRSNKLSGKVLNIR